LREIIDIRFCDEVELTLPYLIEQHYLECDTVSPGAQTYSGVLDIRVLNELRAPETCAQSIDIVMFWTAGDDFEFNNIINTGTYRPVYQSHSNSLISNVIGDAFVPPISTRHAELTHGEMFRSIKQILMQYHNVVNNATVPNTPTIYPWFVSTVGMDSTGNLHGTCGGDPFSALACMYGFFRGSMRVATPVTSTFSYAALQDSSFYSGTTKAIDTGTYTEIAYQTPNVTGAISNSIPLYVDDSSQNYRSYNVPFMSVNKVSFLRPNYTGNQADTILYDSPHARLLVDLTAAPMIHRATGDDFQLSYFICCPPLLLSMT